MKYLLLIRLDDGSTQKKKHVTLRAPVMVEVVGATEVIDCVFGFGISELVRYMAVVQKSERLEKLKLRRNNKLEFPSSVGK